MNSPLPPVDPDLALASQKVAEQQSQQPQESALSGVVDVASAVVDVAGTAVDVVGGVFEAIGSIFDVF